MFVSVCLCLSFQLSAATLSHCVTHAATAGSCPSVVVDGRRAPLKCLWGLIRCTTTQRTRPSTNIAFRRYVEQCATSMLLARAHVLVYVYLCVQMPTPRTLTHTHTHARTRTHTHTHTLSLSLADSFAVLFCYPGTEGRQALVADTIHIPQCARHACPNPSQRIHNHGPGCPACAGGRLQHGVAGGVLPLPLYNSTLAQTSHTHTHSLSRPLSLSLSLSRPLSTSVFITSPDPFWFRCFAKGVSTTQGRSVALRAANECIAHHTRGPVRLPTPPHPPEPVLVRGRHLPGRFVHEGAAVHHACHSCRAH